MPSSDGISQEALTPYIPRCNDYVFISGHGDCKIEAINEEHGLITVSQYDPKIGGIRRMDVERWQLQPKRMGKGA